MAEPQPSKLHKTKKRSAVLEVLLPSILLVVVPIYHLHGKAGFSRPCERPKQPALVRAVSQDLQYGGERCRNYQSVPPWYSADGSLRAVIGGELIAAGSSTPAASAPERNLAAALATGERNRVPELYSRALTDLGLTHLLVPSGLHLGLLAGAVMMLRGPRLLVIAVCGFYTHTLGYSLPLLRAFLFLCLHYYARAFHWRLRIPGAVLFYLLLLLLFDQEALLSVGLHLTIYALWGIYLALALSEGRSKFFRFALVCSSAWLFTSIVMVSSFNQFVPGGALANMLMCSIFGPLVLIPSLLLTLYPCRLFELPIQAFFMLVNKLEFGGVEELSSPWLFCAAAFLMFYLNYRR